ncbi:hypothetical protein [Pedobacter heparinus]|uniref:hypothetical protein n=1 Tax=Pedobacter heparinus TaxID=984 RepID=UPI00292D5B7A|nr:hypothetical protein [Pedobacter heparinus]
MKTYTYINYDVFDIAVRKMRPIVYMDGDVFCCLSGLDAETGVFGCGSTPEDAIDDWRSALLVQLNVIRRGGNVTAVVGEELSSGTRIKSAEVQAFYDEFYSRMATLG